MIPKIIHYCWFGRNPLPPLAIKCIESWKKYLPDYEIKEWNEDNFDVDMIAYTKEAYAAKKYAFVSDYARFWILYKYGGLYFDTDVEIIKPMDEIIACGPFMGCEDEPNDTSVANVAPGLGLGVNSGLSFYKEMLDLYSSKSFQKDSGINTTTVVEYTTQLLLEKGLKNINEIQLVDNIFIYPKEYFCPLNYKTRQLEITDKTLTIHHYMASWLTPWMKFKINLSKLLGKKVTDFLIRIKGIVNKKRI